MKVIVKTYEEDPAVHKELLPYAELQNGEHGLPVPSAREADGTHILSRAEGSPGDVSLGVLGLAGAQVIVSCSTFILQIRSRVRRALAKVACRQQGRRRGGREIFKGRAKIQSWLPGGHEAQQKLRAEILRSDPARLPFPGEG